MSETLSANFPKGVIDEAHGAQRLVDPNDVPDNPVLDEPPVNKRLEPTVEGRRQWAERPFEVSF